MIVAALRSRAVVKSSLSSKHIQSSSIPLLIERGCHVGLDCCPVSDDFGCSPVKDDDRSRLLKLAQQIIKPMPVSPELEQSLHHFVSVVKDNVDVQTQLNSITDLQQLKTIVNEVEPALTGSALIPYEQATSPPKITIDSGILQENIPWRLLRCPGGPLVLQMICKNVNFALWIESC